jgi:hypothetical protein
MSSFCYFNAVYFNNNAVEEQALSPVEQEITLQSAV